MEEFHFIRLRNNFRVNNILKMCYFLKISFCSVVLLVSTFDISRAPGLGGTGGATLGPPNEFVFESCRFECVCSPTDPMTSADSVAAGFTGGHATLFISRIRETER